MIRKLTREQVAAEITKAKATELVEILDYHGVLLVRAKTIKSTTSNAAAVIQAVADVDAALVHDEYKAIKASKAAEKEAAKAAATSHATASGTP